MLSSCRAHRELIDIRGRLLQYTKESFISLTIQALPAVKIAGEGLDY